MALDPTTGAPLFEPDPLAALLALKQDGVTNPMTGDTVSPGLAEQIPGEMLPTPGTDPGNSGRYAQLFAALSAPSPELATQRADEQATQQAHDAALRAQDPAIAGEAATQQAEKLALAQAVPQATAAGTLAVENAKAAAAAAQQDRTAAMMDTRGAQPGSRGFEMSINAEGLPTYKEIQPPSQVQAQIDTGKLAIPLIDTLQSSLADPDIAPYVGAITGRMSGLDSGTPTLSSDAVKGLTANPAVQQKLGAFGLNLVAAATAITKAHMQGRMSAAVLKDFSDKIRGSQSASVLGGVLGASRNLMANIAQQDPNYTAPADPSAQTSDPAGLFSAPAAPQGSGTLASLAQFLGLK